VLKPDCSALDPEAMEIVKADIEIQSAQAVGSIGLKGLDSDYKKDVKMDWDKVGSTSPERDFAEKNRADS